jgi:hypothetical protein
MEELLAGRETAAKNRDDDPWTHLTREVEGRTSNRAKGNMEIRDVVKGF